MNESISWKKAYLLSTIIHVSTVCFIILFFSVSVAKHEQNNYVVSLDLVESMDQGSGHAGGGRAGSLEDSFPEPLSVQAMAQNTTAAPNGNQTLETENELSKIANENIDAVSSKQQNVTPEQVPPNKATNSIGKGKSDIMSGSGGAGFGNGEGTGAGDGVGDGQGYGEGAGSGQGSGYSGVPGTGSQPFDVNGFWAEVNENKQYPFAAVKRHLQGIVGLTTTLDAEGNCLDVSVTTSSGYNMLDDAAIAAVRAACPYPNASGRTITVKTKIMFALN